MKAVITAICTTVLFLSAHGQMGVRGMSARSMGASGRSAPMSRFGVVRPPRAPTNGLAMPRPGIPFVPVAGHRHGVITTSQPFNPFFHNRFFSNGVFFRSPFCFRNPFFCNELFSRRSFFFSNFGAFNEFPFGAFPVVASAPWLTDSAVEDTNAMQQESEALAELQRDLQDERLRREDLERELVEQRTAKAESTQLQPQNEPMAETSELPTILVFRNGTRTEIQNYAIVGKMLYAFTPHRTKKILTSAINVPATIKANGERGVEFHLPRPGQVVTYP